MAKNVTTGRPVPAESIRAQIIAILTAWGMPADNAATTAGIMVETDLMGVDSHGLSMLMTYEEGVQERPHPDRRPAEGAARYRADRACSMAPTGSATRSRPWR